MAFINMRPVNQFFRNHEVSDIKCPICEKGFFIAADEDDADADLQLIHIPQELDKEYIEKDEFTCPFLLKPLKLTGRVAGLLKPPYACPLPEYVKEYNATSTALIYIPPIEFLQESVKQYSRMMELNKSDCKYCGGACVVSYETDSDKFTFKFGCKCTSTTALPDLSRLAWAFARDYVKKVQMLDKRETERKKREDFLNAIISRMPEGFQSSTSI